MNTREAILTRRSCREFTEQPIEGEKLHQLLEAALQSRCGRLLRASSSAATLTVRSALPETIVPHSIIALGYPEADITAPRASRYEADRVHFNQW